MKNFSDKAIERRNLPCSIITKNNLTAMNLKKKNTKKAKNLKEL